jgi:hypothetical protein
MCRQVKTVSPNSVAKLDTLVSDGHPVATLNTSESISPAPAWHTKPAARNQIQFNSYELA